MAETLSLLLLKGAASAVLLAIALCGGLLPLYLQGTVNEYFMRGANALAGGILLAAALVHMLPDASENLDALGADITRAFRPQSDGVFPVAPTLAGLFFLAIALMEVSLKRLAVQQVEAFESKQSVDEGPVCKFMQLKGKSSTTLRPALTSGSGGLSPSTPGQNPMSRLYERTSVENAAVQLQDRSRSSVSGIFLLIMLLIHSLLEGMSIGAQVHTATFVSIFFAVGAHKGLAAFALGSKLLEDCPPGRRWPLYRGVLLFGICSPIGIMLGAYMIDEVKGAGIGMLLSAATGTFLYIAIPELLLPAFEGDKLSSSATLAAVVGFSFMAFLAIWV